MAASLPQAPSFHAQTQRRQGAPSGSSHAAAKAEGGDEPPQSKTPASILPEPLATLPCPLAVPPALPRFVIGGPGAEMRIARAVRRGGSKGPVIRGVPSITISPGKKE
jgi:hypothetical protein